MTQLSPHFSLEELTFTQHRTLDNTPRPDIIDNLKVMAQGMEAVRHLLGDLPIHVNSGYRSAAVNAAVGGVETSAHLTGFACDFTCAAYGEPLAICQTVVRSGLAFDQCIQEGTWVHLSFAPTLRRDVLTKASNGGYKSGL